MLDTEKLEAYIGGEPGVALVDTIIYTPEAARAAEGTETPFVACSLAEACLGGRWWEGYEEKRNKLNADRASGDENEDAATVWRSLQCADGYITPPQPGLANSAPCSDCSFGDYEGPRYHRKDDRCEGCPENSMLMYILMGIFLILLLIFIYYASKTNFNFAAFSISINFFQVTTIFADFKIEWPPEILELMGMFAIVSVDISVVSPECATEVTAFQMWFVMTIAPFAFGAVMGFLLLWFQTFFMVKQHTRLPTWAKRKFSKRLRPPRLLVSTDSDSLGDRVAKKLSNQTKMCVPDPCPIPAPDPVQARPVSDARRIRARSPDTCPRSGPTVGSPPQPLPRFRYSLIAMWVEPLAKEKMEQYYDTTSNAVNAPPAPPASPLACSGNRTARLHACWQLACAW